MAAPALRDAEVQSNPVAPSATDAVAPPGIGDVDPAPTQPAAATRQSATKRTDIVAEPLPATGEPVDSIDPKSPAVTSTSPKSEGQVSEPAIGCAPRTAVAAAEPVRSTPESASASHTQTATPNPLAEPAKAAVSAQPDATPPAATPTASSTDAVLTPATSAPAATTQPEPETPRANAPAATPATTTTTARAVPRPGDQIPAAALDTAAQLVARPGSTPRASATTTRIAAPAEPQAPTLTTAAALAATAAAAAPSQPAPLDMTRHTWPATMIARIERLRDELNAVSTAIRLIPDALGKIDVSLTQADGVTHVHLAAEQPQTRTLLAEAAPKLAELAEQRGLKLGDAHVQSGPGSNGNGGQQSATQQGPRRPATASTPAAQKRAGPSTTEDRIA